MVDEERSTTDNPENNTREEFRIKFTEADGYTVHPASTVRGGVQMRGDFLFEFFTERYEDPTAAVYSIDSGGEIGSHIRNEEFDSAVIREKQVGIMMGQANAFDLAIWTIANLLGDGVSESDVEDVITTEFADKIQTGDNQE